MGAFQVVSGRVTNPGTTITALTVNTGDSFTVRSFPFGAGAYLEEAWVDTDTLGLIRIRSPRLHDPSQGIRLQVPVANRPLLPRPLEQRLYPQDVLTVECTGDAVGTVLGAFLVYYEDLPGIQARLASWEEVMPRIVNVMGAEQNLTTGATAGDYGGSQAINADFDLFKRNIDYALLGYLTDTAVGLVGITGPETGNLRVGGPGGLMPETTSEWFIHLSRLTGRPHIPIINAANVGNTTVDLAVEETATAVDVTLIFAELS